MIDVLGNAGENGLYRAYETWKSWNNPFTFTAAVDAYFEGECRGVRIEGATVFEIAFGSGSFLAWAQQKKGATITGSEINVVSQKAALARDIELLPADFEEVADEHAGRFDTVVGFDVFEHFAVEDIKRRLAALEIMMRPGAHLLMRYPNAQSPFGLAPQNGDPTHKSALSRSIFELLVQKTGFKIVRYDGSYRIGGGGLVRSVVRPLRSILCQIIGGVLNFTYATRIPYDPVVVILLRLDARRRREVCWD